MAMTLRLPEDLRDALGAAAGGSGRSLHAEILWRLRGSFSLGLAEEGAGIHGQSQPVKVGEPEVEADAEGSKEVGAGSASGARRVGKTKERKGFFEERFGPARGEQFR